MRFAPILQAFRLVKGDVTTTNVDEVHEKEEEENELEEKQKQPAGPFKLFRPWLNDGGNEQIGTSRVITAPTALRFNRQQRATIGSTTNALMFFMPLSPATAMNGDNRLAMMNGDENLCKSAIELLATSLGKTDAGHQCLYCGKLYSRKYGLKIHLRTHTGFKPLQCKVCSRAFGDPSNLNKHIRLHIGQGVKGTFSLKCTMCDKMLSRKRDLNRHIASRHDHCQSSLIRR